MISDKRYLGSLCKNGHDYENSGKSLRLKINGGCYRCHIDRTKKKDSLKKLRSNSYKHDVYLPSSEDVAKYKDAVSQEMWKDIVGKIKNINFDMIRDSGKSYQVSSWGRIRYKKDKLEDWFYLKRNMTNGYYMVRILRESIGVHVLVVSIFDANSSDCNLIVRHLDDNGLANYPSNLKWGTYKDNFCDMRLNNNRLEVFVHKFSEDELNNEVWKNIENSKHGVSNLGRIGIFKKGVMVFTKIKVSRNGYLIVSFFNGGKSTKFEVHKLVAKYFIGEKQGDECLIRHLDNDKTNNRHFNLKYGTYEQNAEDRKIVGYNKTRGEDHGNSKLKEIKVIEIKKLLKEGKSMMSISEMFKVHRETIRQIKLGNVWKEVTYET